MASEPVLQDERFQVFEGWPEGRYEVFDKKVGGFFPAWWPSPKEALEGAREWAAESEARGDQPIVLDDGF